MNILTLAGYLKLKYHYIDIYLSSILLPYSHTHLITHHLSVWQFMQYWYSKSMKQKTNVKTHRLSVCNIMFIIKFWSNVPLHYNDALGHNHVFPWIIMSLRNSINDIRYIFFFGRWGLATPTCICFGDALLPQIIPHCTIFEHRVIWSS